MANFQIPAPPSDKRPKNTYEWFGAIIKSLQDTKGVNWNVNNTLNIKELGNSIGNDKNFVATVDRKILESHTPIKLAPNTDLNTLTNNGIYTSDSDNNSQTLVNRPPGAQGFILRVYRIWSDIESRYRSIQIAYNRTTGFMYSRGKSESTDWTNWVGSLYTTDATSTNSANKLVIRDNSGNFSAGTITASLNGNASTATKLATARTISLSGDASGSVNFDGSGNVTLDTTVREVCFVGSDVESSDGWYKVASQTMSGHGDTAVTFMVTSTYGYYNNGILHLHIRSESSRITCRRLVWNTRLGFDKSHFIININGMTWTLYAYQPQIRYGRLEFEILSQGSINDKFGRITLYNSGTRESTTPTATVTSTDVGSHKLYSSVTINGTSFDGSTNITTSQWGTQRTLTIGNSDKPVDGSTNVTWSLAEIGALPLTGGTMTGDIQMNDRQIKLTTVNSGYARIGYEPSTKDVYISNYNNNWLRIKSDATMTIGGHKIYAANNKPTSNDISDATNDNTVNKIVKRDGSGNFSAGTITASLNGNASSATKLATARRLTIGSTGKTFNGTTDLTWTLDDIGAAPTAHNHTSIGSRGVVAAETGTQRPAVDGISMSQVYNNGYPISYGNVLTLSGGGKSQLLIGWGGTSGAHEKAYIRSKRDMDSASWSEWAQIYTSAHKPTPADIGALPVSGGQLSGNLTFSNSGTSLRGIEGFMAENDGWRVMGGGTATDAGYLEIATCDNGNEPIYVRQYTGTSTTTSFTNLVRSATLLDENGNTHFPGIMNIGGRRLACIAGHGGLDVGDTNVAIALCSKNQPLWYDGSNTRELVYSVKDSSGYPCMMSNNNGWIRTPPSGIIPNTSGTGGGRSSLGSQTWTFSSGYINEVYCTGITSVGDLWLTAKNANGYLISQGHIKPSGTAIKYLGESANRWHSVWAANGTIQTSDERFKVKQGLTNIEECFDMIKNTNIYNYVMIGQNKEDLSRNRLGKLAMEHSKIDSNVHMGVMAQDILDYDCAKQIIIEDEYERLDGTTDTMLSINPYNLTSALMGALKVEISKREELETTVSNLEEELTELKELVKSFLNK